MPTVYPSLARARSLSEKPDRTLPGNEGIGLRIQNLVFCSRNNMTFVAIKMDRRKARGGRISKLIRNGRATQPPAHFHRNPVGRGWSAVFRRCSLLAYRFRYARHSRLEKQPTSLRRKTCYFEDRTLGLKEARFNRTKG